MDRLKREWEKVQIPEEVRLRTRNLAWNKIQKPVHHRRRYAWAAAVSATVLATIILVWIRNERETQNPKVFTKTEQSSHFTDSAVSPKTQTLDLAPQQKAVHMRSSTGRALNDMAADQNERVVLNIRLPETGTQMIWILDSHFYLDGGAQ